MSDEIKQQLNTVQTDLTDLALATHESFEDVQKQFKRVDERFEEMGLEISRQFDAVDKRFNAMDQRFDAMDQRFDALESKVDALCLRIDSVENRIERRHADFMDWMRIHTMRASDMGDRTDRLEGRILRLEA